MDQGFLFDQPLAKYWGLTADVSPRQKGHWKLVVKTVAHQSPAQDAGLVQGQALGKPGYVSRPTIYRTLIEFVDAGLLRRFELDGRAVYEHDYGYPQHDHLHCTRCDQLFEFQSAELLQLRDIVARDRNFRVSGHRLIISGICEKCNRQPRRQRRKQDLI